jgi:hypothetical protein
VSCSRGAYTEARKDLKRTAGSDANYLVDAGARILQAMRVVSLPTNFSQVLTDAILQQIDGPEITPKACAVITASVQSQYSSAQLQASASIRCKLAKPNLAEGFG